MTDPDPRPTPVSPAGFDGSADPALPRQGPIVVPAGRGSAWWGEGWRLFTPSPWTWIAIMLLFIVIMAMLGKIPLVGWLATFVLDPVFAGGILCGCRDVDRGEKLSIGHLFASFSHRLTPLIVVGVLYLVGTLAILTVVVGGLAATIGLTALEELLTGDPFEMGFGIMAAISIGAMLAVLVGLLLWIPLLMAYWYAPALVVFRNEEPMAAMKLSFDASLVNMLPLTVYSLIGVVFMVIASIPLGLGWFVLLPVFATSVYASYKDIFGDPR